MKPTFNIKNTTLFLILFVLMGNVTCTYSMPVTAIIDILKKVADSQFKQEKHLADQLKIQKNNSSLLNNFTVSPTDSKVRNLVKSMDAIDSFKKQSGSLDNYLTKYQDSEYYKSKPCFNGKTCSNLDRKQLQNKNRLNSQDQKKANNAMLKSLDLHQDALSDDARKIMKLQQDAKSATGQNSALQASNQLASAQNEQLIQLRALLISQQTADATQRLAEADKKAQQEAADEEAKKVVFKRIQGKKW